MGGGQPEAKKQPVVIPRHRLIIGRSAPNEKAPPGDEWVL